jgi:hypothetical protein
MLPEIAREELVAVFETVALDLLAQAGIERPPVDAFRLAAALSITVALDEHQQGRARFVRLAGHRGGESKPTILLRPDPRRERRQWAVAHEIGEHTAWRVFGALGVDPRETSPLAREGVANHLANRLLLPGAWFAVDAAACGWDLLRLKTVFSTASHELIARRMLDFPASIIITMFDQRQISLRRSNVPGRVPEPSPAETRCWRQVHQSNRSYEVEDGMQTIRGWPIHEEHWRREILRTELGEQD